MYVSTCVYVCESKWAIEDLFINNCNGTKTTRLILVVTHITIKHPRRVAGRQRGMHSTPLYIYTYYYGNT